MDEVNLGQKSVLQCMETALDTGEIKQDIPGCGTIKKNIHPDFIIVATQNPKIERIYKPKRWIISKIYFKIYSSWISIIWNKWIKDYCQRYSKKK